MRCSGCISQVYSNDAVILQGLTNNSIANITTCSKWSLAKVSDWHESEAKERIREPYIDLAALTEGERFGRHFLTPFGGNHRVYKVKKMTEIYLTRLVIGARIRKKKKDLYTRKYSISASTPLQQMPIGCSQETTAAKSKMF